MYEPVVENWQMHDQRSKMKDLKTQHKVSKKYIYILKWSSSKQILVVLVLGQLGVEGNILTFGMWLDALSVRDTGAVSLLLLVRISFVLYFPSLYLQQTTSTKNSVQLCIIPENNGKQWLTDILVQTLIISWVKTVNTKNFKKCSSKDR